MLSLHIVRGELNEKDSTAFQVGRMVVFDISFGQDETLASIDINDITVPSSNYTILGNRVYGYYVITSSNYINTYSFKFRQTSYIFLII